MKYISFAAGFLILLVMTAGTPGYASTDSDQTAAVSAGAFEGKWIVEPGKIELTFKTSGSKLVGILNNPAAPGDAQVSKLKIDGNSISFSLERSFGSVDWKGNLSGDEIKFTRTSSQSGTESLVAKRIK
jgi:hypothetical protein